MDINKFIKVNESILDPFVEEMSSEIWDKNLKLKSSVRVHIIKRLETWLKNYTNKEATTIYLLGSMTGYQYSANSDIDINFVVAVDDEELDKMKKELPNGQLLPGTKHPINYFGSNKIIPDWKNAGPIYDVLKERWRKKPSTKRVEEAVIVGSYRVVIEMARFFMSGLDAIITEFHSDVAAYNSYLSYEPSMKVEGDKKALADLIKFKLDEIISDIDGVRLAAHILHSMRAEAFQEEKYFQISTQIVIKDSANTSINNMIYKYIEKLGYPEKIKEILDDKDSWLEKLSKK